MILEFQFIILEPYEIVFIENLFTDVLFHGQ